MRRANGILKNHLTSGQTASIAARLVGKDPTGPLWNGPPQWVFFRVVAYRRQADVALALRNRHAALTRYLKEHPGIGRLLPEEEFVARYARFYFAAGN